MKKWRIHEPELADSEVENLDVVDALSDATAESMDAIELLVPKEPEQEEYFDAETGEEEFEDAINLEEVAEQDLKATLVEMVHSGTSIDTRGLHAKWKAYLEKSAALKDKEMFTLVKSEPYICSEHKLLSEMEMLARTAKIFTIEDEARLAKAMLVALVDALSESHHHDASFSYMQSYVPSAYSVSNPGLKVRELYDEISMEQIFVAVEAVQKVSPKLWERLKEAYEVSDSWRHYVELIKDIEEATRYIADDAYMVEMKCEQLIEKRNENKVQTIRIDAVKVAQMASRSYMVPWSPSLGIEEKAGLQGLAEKDIKTLAMIMGRVDVRAKRTIIQSPEEAASRFIGCAMGNAHISLKEVLRTKQFYALGIKNMDQLVRYVEKLNALWDQFSEEEKTVFVKMHIQLGKSYEFPKPSEVIKRIESKPQKVPSIRGDLDADTVKKRIQIYYQNDKEKFLDDTQEKIDNLISLFSKVPTDGYTQGQSDLATIRLITMIMDPEIKGEGYISFAEACRNNPNRYKGLGIQDVASFKAVLKELNHRWEELSAGDRKAMEYICAHFTDLDIPTLGRSIELSNKKPTVSLSELLRAYIVSLFAKPLNEVEVGIKERVLTEYQHYWNNRSEDSITLTSYQNKQIEHLTRLAYKGLDNRFSLNGPRAEQAAAKLVVYLTEHDITGIEQSPLADAPEDLGKFIRRLNDDESLTMSDRLMVSRIHQRFENELHIPKPLPWYATKPFRHLMQSRAHKEHIAKRPLQQEKVTWEVMKLLKSHNQHEFAETQKEYIEGLAQLLSRLPVKKGSAYQESDPNMSVAEIITFIVRPEIFKDKRGNCLNEKTSFDVFIKAHKHFDLDMASAGRFQDAMRELNVQGLSFQERKVFTLLTKRFENDKTVWLPQSRSWIAGQFNQLVRRLTREDSIARRFLELDPDADITNESKKDRHERLGMKEEKAQLEGWDAATNAVIDTLEAVEDGARSVAYKTFKWIFLSNTAMKLYLTIGVIALGLLVATIASVELAAFVGVSPYIIAIGLGVAATVVLVSIGALVVRKVTDSVLSKPSVMSKVSMPDLMPHVLSSSQIKHDDKKGSAPTKDQQADESLEVKKGFMHK